MSSNMSLFKQGGAISAKFQQANMVADDLGEGIRGSYGIISIKAGRFRIKYKGAENMVTTPNPQGGQPMPVSSIDVVIIKANPFLNKQYYSGKYVEGANNPPDCYSLDGKVPSPMAPHPQHNSCALCPKNQFGSMIGDNGVKQKACRDTKKLAVVPLSDIMNESLGGAMLFRVPPSSLKDLSSMSDALKSRGYPYNAVAVRIGFDMTVSHPKPTFEAIRYLDDNEAEKVLEMFYSDSTERVLADNDPVPDVEDATPAPAQPAVTPVAMPPAAVVPLSTSGMLNTGGVLVTPFNPAAQPPGPEVLAQKVTAAPQATPIAAVFAATPVPQGAQEVTPQGPAAPPRGRGRPPKAHAAVQPVAAPVAPQALPEPAPTATQLDSDISSILAGLSAFSGGK